MHYHYCYLYRVGCFDIEDFKGYYEKDEEEAELQDSREEEDFDGGEEFFKEIGRTLS